MASTHSSSELNTLHGPEWTSMSSFTAPCLITQPLGATFPYNTAIPPSVLIGSSNVWITL